MIPKAGSAYTYGYAVLGELAGWFIGWDLLLEYTAIVAVVGIGISGYFSFLVNEMGADLPAWMLGAPGTGDGHRVDLFAALLCLLIAALLNLGIKNAARFETVVVVLKVLVVLLVIGVGVFHIRAEHYEPFFPFGVGGAFTGAATVFFAVFGYDAMSTAAEESKDAQRHMPKAIIYSLIISMVLYVAACLVLTGMQDYKDIDPESGFSTAFKSVGLSGLADVIAVGAIIGILTVMFTFMLGVTRVWFSMSRDGLLPRWFAKTHPTRHVPTRVTWIVGVASAAIAGFLPIGEAAELTNIGILLAFVVVCTAVIVLRYRQPELPRSFRTPWMPVVPGGGRGVLDLADHVPPVADLGAVRRVVRDRPGRLLRLLLPAFGARAGGRGRRRETGPEGLEGPEGLQEVQQDAGERVGALQRGVVPGAVDRRGAPVGDRVGQALGGGVQVGRLQGAVDGEQRDADLTDAVEGAGDPNQPVLLLRAVLGQRVQGHLAHAAQDVRGDVVGGALRAGHEPQERVEPGGHVPGLQRPGHGPLELAVPGVGVLEVAGHGPGGDHRADQAGVFEHGVGGDHAAHGEPHEDRGPGVEVAQQRGQVVGPAERRGGVGGEAVAPGVGATTRYRSASTGTWSSQRRWSTKPEWSRTTRSPEPVSR